MGVKETEPNVRTRPPPRKFAAVFLVQYLEAIGAPSYA